MSPCFSLIVLLLIRKGLVRVLAQLRRLVRIVADAQPAQGQDIRRDKEYLRSVLTVCILPTIIILEIWVIQTE